jgi:maltooligosyltrehalose trehalohydrolase
MTAGAEGWWQIDCEPARVQDGYRYSLDGGPPMPDPRSAWQPRGVHGPSFVVDQEGLKAITRSDFVPEPLRGAVIYELHIGTFTPAGTYAGAIGKLPHLAALGITHIEIMPLATFPGNHGWGYDGVYLFAPHRAYGTPCLRGWPFQSELGSTTTHLGMNGALSRSSKLRSSSLAPSV